MKKKSSLARILSAAEPNEFLVLVIDRVQRTVLQCIDSSCPDGCL